MSDLIEEEEPALTPSPEELEEFKGRVSEWTKLDDQIRKLSVAIRERKVHQKALSEGITSFMRKFGYDNLNTNQGRIHHSVRKVKTPIKLTEVKEILTQRKELNGEALLREIFEKERPTVEKESIRRVIPKVSMHLEI